MKKILIFSQKAYENFGENMLLLQCRNPASLPKSCHLVSTPLPFLLSSILNYKVIKYSCKNKTSLKYRVLQSLYFKVTTENFFKSKNKDQLLLSYILSEVEGTLKVPT